jgi:hypothetical protein
MVNTAANQIPPVLVIKKNLNIVSTFASGAAVPYINNLSLVIVSDSAVVPDAIANL